MASLKTLREVHAFNVKVAELGRFLAKSAERKGYLTPWLRCVGPEQANYVLRKAHFGSCGAHAGAQSITQKCELTSISSPWPFYQWGIDIVGPFPEAPGRVKFLIVTIDYFTKWVEAEPVAPITDQKILQFVWHNIICRVRIPGIIVSDNGKQFSNNPFREWCEELEIKQNFTSGTHPQANGQTEVTNPTILQVLKAKVGKAKGQWIKELPNVLWAYQTTTRTGNKCTPFSLVYGSEPVLPLEIGLPTYRISNFDPTTNDINHRVNLDLL
ncbi:reverse transcriptase domain-containing protein [Tanacetum coccineum]